MSFSRILWTGFLQPNVFPLMPGRKVLTFVLHLKQPKIHFSLTLSLTSPESAQPSKVLLDSKLFIRKIFIFERTLKNHEPVSISACGTQFLGKRFKYVSLSLKYILNFFHCFPGFRSPTVIATIISKAVVAAVVVALSQTKLLISIIS